MTNYYSTPRCGQHKHIRWCLFVIVAPMTIWSSIYYILPGRLTRTVSLPVQANNLNVARFRQEEADLDVSMDMWKQQKNLPPSAEQSAADSIQRAIASRQRAMADHASALAVAAYRVNHTGNRLELCTVNRVLQKYMETAKLKKMPPYIPNYKAPCFYVQGGPKCLPYAHILGVAKSGTSMLHLQLLRHRDILQSALREEHFLNLPDANFWDFVEDFDMASAVIYGDKDEIGYHRKFAVEAKPLLFTTPVNTWPSNRSADEEPICTMAHTMHAIFPHAKLIVNLRDPVMRLLSHFRQASTKGRAYLHSPEKFHNNTIEAIQLVNRCLSTRSLRSCAFDAKIDHELRALNVFLMMSLYYPFAAEWLSVYAPEQIYFIKSEEFYKDARGVMTDVFRFVDVDTPEVLMTTIGNEMDTIYKTSQSAERQNTSFHNHLWEDTRKILNDFYAPYNKKLATLLGDDKWLFQSSK